MRTILAAAGFGLLATMSAQAACPNIPDNSSSGYVDNGAQRSLCLQQQMSNKLELHQEIQSQVAAAQAQLQTEMKLQEMQQQIRSAQHDFRYR